MEPTVVIQERKNIAINDGTTNDLPSIIDTAVEVAPGKLSGLKWPPLYKKPPMGLEFPTICPRLLMPDKKVRLSSNTMRLKWPPEYKNPADSVP
jgi:hypothetical protein